MKYYHVDVFTDIKFSGNGLTIFPYAENLERKMMQLITQEMRQFESIFLSRLAGNTFRAYIFTMEEELDFAGHPIIGAAAVLHDIFSPHQHANTWVFELNEKKVEVTTLLKQDYYAAKMNQGKPIFGQTLSTNEVETFLQYLNLNYDDRFEGLPFQVVSTGLPYLVIPVKASALPNVRVTIKDLEKKLSKIGAKFFFVLDIENRQGRTWDNLGFVEDIATGSAAGPVGAYLIRNELEKHNTEITLKQGDFLSRPSKIRVFQEMETKEIFVEGDVCKMAEGTLLN